MSISSQKSLTHKISRDFIYKSLRRAYHTQNDNITSKEKKSVRIILYSFGEVIYSLVFIIVTRKTKLKKVNTPTFHINDFCHDKFFILRYSSVVVVIKIKLTCITTNAIINPDFESSWLATNPREPSLGQANIISVAMQAANVLKRLGDL